MHLPCISQAHHQRIFIECVRATPWGDEPPIPVHRCVAHVLAMIVSQIEEETAGKDNLEVTADEVLNRLRSKWPRPY